MKGLCIAKIHILAIGACHSLEILLYDTPDCVRQCALQLLAHFLFAVLLMAAVMKVPWETAVLV